MKKTLITLISLLTFSMYVCSQNPKVILNFEESEHFNITDMTQPVDNTTLDNTLFNSVFHVNLYVGSLASGVQPRYATAGGSFRAFRSSNGKDCHGDIITNQSNYIEGGVTNCFFITDFSVNQDIYIDVDESMLQVNRVSLDLLDVDFAEVLHVDIYAVGQTTVYASKTINAQTPCTSNSEATNVSLNIESEVIDYIHVRSSTNALIGLDNIVLEQMDYCGHPENCDLDAAFELNANCQNACVITSTGSSTSSAVITNHLWVLTDLATNDVAGTHTNSVVTVCVNGASCPSGVDIVADPSPSGYELCLYVEDADGCIAKYCEILGDIAGRNIDQHESAESIKKLETGELIKASPNPFKKQLNLSFELEQPSHVVMRVYNSQMQHIATIGQNYEYEAGSHFIEWSPENDLSAGIYFVEFSISKGERIVKKLLHIQ